MIDCLNLYSWCKIPYDKLVNHLELKTPRSLGIAGVRGRCGGILVVEPPKYPHILSLSTTEIPKDPNTFSLKDD